jgi:hypothetical protein
MDDSFVPDVTEERPQVATEERAQELVDRLGPDATRALVTTAVRQFLADNQREVWRRRRERILHVLTVVEHQLDYDLRARGLAGDRSR